MTKTIEEVKAAKRELELKISQMVNEFAEVNDCRVAVDVRNTGQQTIGRDDAVYYCTVEIKL